MSTAFTLTGILSYPPDDGQPAARRTFSQAGNFDSKIEADYILTGSGTQVIDFGTVAEAKMVLLEVDPASLGTVNIIVNAGTDQTEVTPGGFWAYSNPTPGAGISGLSVIYDNDCRVRVRVLG